MTDFERWQRALRSQLLFYGVGGGQVLSPTELSQLYFQHGVSVHTAYDISTDVANGFSFADAVAAAKGQTA